MAPKWGGTVHILRVAYLACMRTRVDSLAHSELQQQHYQHDSPLNRAYNDGQSDDGGGTVDNNNYGGGGGDNVHSHRDRNNDRADDDGDEYHNSDRWSESRSSAFWMRPFSKTGKCVCVCGRRHDSSPGRSGGGGCARSGATIGLHAHLCVIVGD